MDSGLRWVGMPAAPDWLLPPEAPPGFAAGWADTPAGAAFLDQRRGAYHIPSVQRGQRRERQGGEEWEGECHGALSVLHGE